MKKNLLSIALIIASVYTTNLKAQTIPNPNFENWTTTTFNEPFSWTTSNYESLKKANTITTTSISGFSGDAVHMQTKVVGMDTLVGYIMYGSVANDPTSGKGGLPYSQKPTNITGYCRYNLPGNDTALIFVLFKKNGVILSQEWKKIRGTGTQSTFAPFTYTLSAPSLTVNPDSVIIAFASSNAQNNIDVQNNSYLEVDEIAFTGPGITQTITNSGFENWNNTSIDNVSSWGATGDGITKASPGFYGNFAIQLETTLSSDSNNPVSQSGITNGYFPQNSGPKGGKPYTLTSDTLYGYYKFSGSNDSGVVYANLSKLNSPVGGGPKYLKSSNNWTFFKLPISGSTPDTMRIEIYSSNPGSTVATAVGSKLTIDNLYLYSEPNVGIKVNTINSDFLIYPNPCKDRLVIKTNNDYGTYQVFDALGNKIVVTNLSQLPGQLKLNVEPLPNGIYILMLEQAGRITTTKFVKE